jgi:hypothetical protein
MGDRDDGEERTGLFFFVISNSRLVGMRDLSILSR